MVLYCVQSVAHLKTGDYDLMSTIWNIMYGTTKVNMTCQVGHGPA